jgi:hypothetical protein
VSEKSPVKQGKYQMTKSPTKDHRLKEFSTSTPSDANIMRMIDEKTHRKSHNKLMADHARVQSQVNPVLPVRPRQPSPVKQVHFSSPLRDRSPDYSPAKPMMASGVASRSTMPTTQHFTGSRRVESEDGLF